MRHRGGGPAVTEWLVAAIAVGEQADRSSFQRQSRCRAGDLGIRNPAWDPDARASRRPRGALEARVRHLGTPDLPMPAEDVARIVMSIIGGLSVDELIEPGSARPELLGETLALVYAGLVARAQGRAGS